MKKTVIKLVKFMGISGLAWITDFIIYNILVYICKINIDISNMISAVIGASIVFIFSTIKIFLSDDENKISLKAKYAIYIIYQIILIITVSKVLLILKSVLISTDIKIIVDYVNIIVKILVAPITFLLNYNVIKLLIEKL